MCCAANNILREYGFKEGLFTENASFAESVQKNEKLFYQLFRLFQLWEVFCSGNQGVLDSWIDFTVLLNDAFDNLAPGLLLKYKCCYQIFLSAGTMLQRV